jgi:hypothetical protein
VLESHAAGTEDLDRPALLRVVQPLQCHLGSTPVLVQFFFALTLQQIIADLACGDTDPAATIGANPPPAAPARRQPRPPPGIPPRCTASSPRSAPMPGPTAPGLSR